MFFKAEYFHKPDGFILFSISLSLMRPILIQVFKMRYGGQRLICWPNKYQGPDNERIKDLKFSYFLFSTLNIEQPGEGRKRAGA